MAWDPRRPGESEGKPNPEQSAPRVSEVSRQERRTWRQDLEALKPDNAGPYETERTGVLARAEAAIAELSRLARTLRIPHGTASAAAPSERARPIVKSGKPEAMDKSVNIVSTGTAVTVLPLMVIAILGAVWAINTRLEDRLTKRMDRMEDRATKRMDGIEARIDGLPGEMEAAVARALQAYRESETRKP